MRAARIASHAVFGAKRKKHGLKAHAECGCIAHAARRTLRFCHRCVSCICENPFLMPLRKISLASPTPVYSRLESLRSLPTDRYRHTAIQSHCVRVKLPRCGPCVAPRALNGYLLRCVRHLSPSSKVARHGCSSRSSARRVAKAASFDVRGRSSVFRRVRGHLFLRPQQDKLPRPSEEVSGRRVVSCDEPLHAHPFQARQRVGETNRLPDRRGRKKVVDRIGMSLVFGGDCLSPLGACGGSGVVAWRKESGAPGVAAFFWLKQQTLSCELASTASESCPQTTGHTAVSHRHTQWTRNNAKECCTVDCSIG